MVSTSGWQIISLFVALALAVQADARIRMQPVGIDLGPEIVTAAYAYETDNVTVISTITPDADGTYRDTMLRLQLLHAQNRPSPFGKQKPATPGVLRVAKSAVQTAVSLIEPYLPYLHYIGLPGWAGGAASAVINTVSAALGTSDLLGQLTPDEIKQALIPVLRQVRANARTDYNIRITSAIFSAPSFFNSTLNDIVVEAAQEVGIWTSPMVLPRGIAVTHAQNDDPKGKKGTRYLIIDQGEYHCDMRTGYTGSQDDQNAIKPILMPLEPYASANINRRLAERLIGGSKELQNQVAWGAKRGDLWQVIKKARFLIRDDIDFEIMGEEKTEEHHFDEYPLDLRGWGDGSVQAVLKWEDVQEEEAEFVNTLASNIMKVMIAVRGMQNPETFDQNKTLEEVDRVVILTSHYDGQLIKRAIQSVVGESVEIIGGTIRGYQLAAIGAAQVALTAKKQSAKPRQCKSHDEL